MLPREIKVGGVYAVRRGERVARFRAMRFTTWRDIARKTGAVRVERIIGQWQEPDSGEEMLDPKDLICPFEEYSDTPELDKLLD